MFKPLSFVPSCDFSHERDCRHGVFVADEILGQEAVAFLAAAQIAGFAFVFAHHVGNPFEAGEAVIHLYVLSFGDCADCLGCHDCLHDVFIAGECAELRVAGHQIVEENHHNLVSVDEHILAVVVADHEADAVSVGVGSHHYLCAGFLCFLDGHCHSRRLFWVWRSDGREVAAEHFLLRHADDVCEAVVCERAGNQFQAGSVDWRVDNLHVVMSLDCLWAERQAFYFSRKILSTSSPMISIFDGSPLNLMSATSVTSLTYLIVLTS